MEECLNCKKELISESGKREKKFCDDKCRASYWQKNKKKEPKYVQFKTFQELQDKFNALNKGRDNKFENAARGRDENGVNNDEQKSVDTTEKPKHKLYNEKDPKEGSNGFYLKYGVFTYDEL